VPEIMQIGSFMIQTKVLILIVSIIFAYYVVRWKLGRVQIPDEISRKLLDKMINAVILAIFVWKFTPLLQEPSLLWTRPLSLLAYTGGTLGLALGITAGLLYTAVALWRSRSLFPIVLDALAYGVLIAWSLYRVAFWEYGTLTDMPWGITLTDPRFQYHPLHLYAGMIGMGVALYAWFARSGRWGTGTIARDVYTGLGLGWFMVTLFQRVEVTFLLSTEQWLFLALAATGMMMPYIARMMPHTPAAATTDGERDQDVATMKVDGERGQDVAATMLDGERDQAVAATMLEGERDQAVATTMVDGERDQAVAVTMVGGERDQDVATTKVDGERGQKQTATRIDEHTIAGLIQSSSDEHTNDRKEMMEVVKETSMNSSPEQRKQSQDNRAEEREFKPTQAVDKKLDGPNRPAE